MTTKFMITNKLVCKSLEADVLLVTGPVRRLLMVTFTYNYKVTMRILYKINCECHCRVIIKGLTPSFHTPAIPVPQEDEAAIDPPTVPTIAGNRANVLPWKTNHLSLSVRAQSFQITPRMLQARAFSHG